MKIIGISSSPLQNSRSNQLLEYTLAGIKEANKDVQITRVNLNDYNIEHCKGCRGCMATSQCIIKDDLSELLEMLKSADGIILSTPTHNMGPNSLMKAFLDRTIVYSHYRSTLSDKYLLTIATAGGMGAKGTAKSMTNLVNGIHRSGHVFDSVGIHVGWETVDAYESKMRALGSRFVNDISLKKTYPFKNIFGKLINNTIVKSIMVNNILKEKDKRMKGVYRDLVISGYIQ